jgi:hypothetical protein
MHATRNPIPLRPSPDDELTVAHVLRAAADYLKTHGWIQRRLFADDTSPFPPADVTGAIAIVCYGYLTWEPELEPCNPDRAELVDPWHWFVTAQAFLETVVTDVTDATSLDRWNDARSRTPGEVRGFLRFAADLFTIRTVL